MQCMQVVISKENVCSKAVSFVIWGFVGGVELGGIAAVTSNAEELKLKCFHSLKKRGKSSTS